MKSGFIAIVGLPNVGKSSILNRLIGQKVAIVSNKPQTTRNRILAVMTEKDSQAVFIDTPGIHTPRTKLGNFMMKSAHGAVNDVDMLLFVTEARKNVLPLEAQMLSKAEELGCKTVLAINKTDIAKKEAIIETIKAFADVHEFDAVVPVSAKTGEGMDELHDEIIASLEEGPMYFPEDELTDQPEKQIAAEMIREKALICLNDEVPHGIAIEIEKFKERTTAKGEDIIEIEAALYCEKESHKGIIIGKGGSMLKKISMLAREDMEDFFACKVYLRTFVKIKENWRDSDFMLKNFGYVETND